MSKIAASPIGVKEVPPEDLHPNPHNPRVLFDKLPLANLKESIRRVGVLVPLTVYWEQARSRYVILDGQRRWICAQQVGLRKIPINQVAEPDLVQNIVTMFQIHKLRQDWELMPTALKVQLLMEEINDKNDARLAELTGLPEAVIVRCKKLISYPRRYQDMMLEPDPDKRIKADFFIELYAVLHDKDVTKMVWFGADEFTDQMLAKYLEKPSVIKSVTDFRLIKQHITNARRKALLSQFSKRLRHFAAHREVPLSSLDIEEATVHAEAKALSRKVRSLRETIENIDSDEFFGEEELWIELKELASCVEGKLRKADIRR